MSPVSGLTIGEVAHRAGVAPSAIRYYESLGLIDAPPRLHGERRYPDDVFTALDFIAVAQSAGFTLKEIQILAAHADADHGLAQIMQVMAEHKLAEVESTLERATAMKQWLEVARQCGCSVPGDCKLFESGAGKPLAADSGGCHR